MVALESIMHLISGNDVFLVKPWLREKLVKQSHNIYHNLYVLPGFNLRFFVGFLFGILTFFFAGLLALTANAFLGAFPPSDFRAVCLVLAILMRPIDRLIVI